MIPAFAAALVATAAVQAPAAEPGPPNVVVILADDLGAECLGSYGGQDYATPRLDRMAREGMRFTHFLSQPLCTPSRVKLLTGRSNVFDYVGFSILDPGARTIAHRLRDAGYATGAVGKWQLLGAEHYGDRAGAGSTPAQAGFDEWCLWQVARLGSRYADPLLDVDGEERPALEGGYGPDAFASWAEAFVARHAERPFFLFYPMVLTHGPFEPTSANPGRDPGDGAGCFADMVAAMDASVGRVLDALEREGVADRTLVLFLSDNGTPTQIRTRARGREVRGAKRSPTDAGTRVPLIARWPGVVPPRTVSDDLVDLSDVLPTACALAGVELDGPPVDGVSFAPRLRGEAFVGREWVFVYHDPRPGNPRFPAERFVRGRRYKLYGTGELYDLWWDPSEERALAADAVPAERERLAAVLARYPAVGEAIVVE